MAIEFKHFLAMFDDPALHGNVRWEMNIDEHLVDLRDVQ